MSAALPEADPLAIAQAVASEAASQPELFGGAAFSAQELEVVRHARLGRYDGSRTRDEARVATVVALRQQGCSLREIERRTGMDTRLVSVVIREAEKHRAVPAIKDMITRRLAETTERALDRLDEELSRQAPDPQLVRSLGVVAGIGADKVSASSSPAGDLHLHQHVHVAGSDPVRDYLQQRAAALATESESAGAPMVPAPIPTVPSAAAGLAAGSSGSPLPDGPTVDVEPASHRSNGGQFEGGGGVGFDAPGGPA